MTAFIRQWNISDFLKRAELMRIKKKNRYKKQKYKLKGTVTISPEAFLIGLIGLPFFIFLLVMSLKESIWMIGLSVCFVLMDIFLILTINWKITYDSNGFTYRNIFRISKYYHYSEVTKIYIDRDSYIAIGRKKIHIESMADGKHFLMQAQRQSKQAQKLSVQDRKLFNGNVRNAEEFVFFYVLILIFIIGAWIAVLVMFRPLKLENLEKTVVKLSDSREACTENDVPYLKLTPVQDDSYFMLYRPADYDVNLDLLKEEIQNDSYFEIYYEIYETEQRVLQLTSKKENYLLLEAVNAENVENRFGLSLVMTIFTGVFISFGLIANHIMSHAERYPNAVKLFVKESYIVRKYK